MGLKIGINMYFLSLPPRPERWKERGPRESTESIECPRKTRSAFFDRMLTSCPRRHLPAPCSRRQGPRRPTLERKGGTTSSRSRETSKGDLRGTSGESHTQQGLVKGLVGTKSTGFNSGEYTLHVRKLKTLTRCITARMETLLRGLR